ncbi:MFS transporter [Nocardia australiensis]|uniref:MFS transporter n=1 Tax=Nocardia australiensis TaxID=2887191 RepID=UPI001D1595E1|nr:MFS transporter [Nocardia australiensis]
MNIVYQRKVAKRPAPLGFILAVACGAQFMVVLDSLIVNVALPDMKSELGLSVAGQQWIVNAYLIAFGGLLLFAARAADLVGHRRMFSSGLAVFTLASLIGGFAEDGWLLLVARAVQGVGAAALAPSSLSLITSTHTETHQRRHALAIWAATSGSAGAIGLVIGGIITDTLGWRWVLFINVPIGVILFVAAGWSLRSAPPTGRTGLDLPGAITVTLGIGSLVYGISQATEHGWGSAPVVIALLAAAVFVGMFVVVETRSRAPLIPLAIFRRRNIVIANTIMALLGTIMTATMFFLSIYQQQVLGYSPLRTGLALLPMSVVIVIGAITSKTLLPRLGARKLLVSGAALTTVGLLWMAALPAEADYLAQILGPTVLWACGISVMSLPVTDIATAGIEPESAGLASGLVNTARQVGGAIGLAALTTVAGTITTRTDDSAPRALVHGYHAALIVAAGITLIVAMLALLTPPAATAARDKNESRL